MTTSASERAQLRSSPESCVACREVAASVSIAVITV
jgi:hypothetical protein